MSVSAADVFNGYTGNLAWLPSRTILLTRHGSHAYGTNLPSSDLDIKGIAVAPGEYYLGFLHHFEQAEMRAPMDVVVYDIRKFWKLAADCNPNIVEVLFTDESDWILSSRYDRSDLPPNLWREVYESRDLFLSQKARHTFSGYAIAQLKRIETHRRWLLNPPKAKPQRSDYGLKDTAGNLGKEQLGVVEARIRKLEDTLGGKGFTKDAVETERLQEQLVQNALTELDLDMNLLPVIVAERRYASAARNWDQFQKWKEERNPARAELEARFGYDTKHAMHLVRLVRMAKEILGTGKVIVKRPDAEELLQIRAGAWPYDRLMQEATGMDAELQALTPTSPLPHAPDRAKLDELLVRLVRQAIGQTS